jgi:ABC-type uncharacterized transport system permease subunit
VREQAWPSRTLLAAILGAIFGLVLGVAIAAALMFSGSLGAARYASTSLVLWSALACAFGGVLLAWAMREQSQGVRNE